MLEQVVKHTDERAKRDLRKRSKNPDKWMPFDLCEMKDIVDVLHLIGVYRCQHESLHLLWSLAHQEELYSSLLSTAIALSNSKQSYVLTVVKIVTWMISLLHFGKCGNSFLRITEKIMLPVLM